MGKRRASDASVTELDRLRTEIAELRKVVEGLEKHKEALLLDLQTHHASSSTFSLRHEELQRQVEAQLKKILQLQDQNKEQQSTYEAQRTDLDRRHDLQLRKMNDVIGSMKEQLLREQADHASLKIVHEKAATRAAVDSRKTKEAFASLEARTHVLQGDKESLIQELKQDSLSFRQQKKDLQQQLLQSDARTKVKEDQISSIKAALEAQEADHKKQLAELQHRLKMERKETLQEATNIITKNLVRMCVVAPMVTINWGDKSMRFKTSMPSDKIRKIVDKEVLPNFTILFRQGKEGASPMGSETSLDNWLVKMGDQMQKALEKELLHVFKEATSN